MAATGAAAAGALASSEAAGPAAGASGRLLALTRGEGACAGAGAASPAGAASGAGATTWSHTPCKPCQMRRRPPVDLSWEMPLLDTAVASGTEAPT